MVDTYDNTFVKTHRMYIKAELMEFGWLWCVTVATLIVTMYHLLWDLTVGRLWVLRVERIKDSVSSAQFCWESKTFKNVYFFLSSFLIDFFLNYGISYNNQYVYSCLVCVQSCLVTPWSIAHQALLSIEFSKQKYWSR